MHKCWSYEAKERPTFADIVAEISAILTSECDYLTFEPSPSPEGLPEGSEFKATKNNVALPSAAPERSEFRGRISSPVSADGIVINSQAESESTVSGMENSEPKLTH